MDNRIVFDYNYLMSDFVKDGITEEEIAGYEKKIADAISYAKELKDRYTVLWMYYDLFGPRANR